MKALLLIPFLLFATPVLADFTSASQAYENKSYIEAYKQFKQLAVIGNKRAQTNLAIMYLQGEGTDTDLTEAYAWLKLAQEETNPEHENTLNMIRSKLSKEQLLVAEEKADRLTKKYSTSQLISQLSPITLADHSHSPSTKPQIEIIKRAQPRFPGKLSRAGSRGWVSVEFDIHPDGSVHNPSIADAYPNDAFNQVSIDAISKWQYKLTFDEGITPKPYPASQTFIYTYHDDRGFKNAYNSRLNIIKNRALKGNSRAQYVYAIAANVSAYVDKEDFIEQEEVNNWLFKSAQNG
ncbi:MAG: TonB family protein, partial [Xanthomonadales bacterium]|nr:TonB family protein [Xanthomonadales bacterium]